MSRRQWTKDEKKQIIMASLKGEESASELCRRHGLHDVTFYKWKKQFIEGGIEALGRDGKATSREVQLLRENEELKRIIGDLTIENQFLKKLQK